MPEGAQWERHLDANSLVQLSRLRRSLPEVSAGPTGTYTCTLFFPQLTMTKPMLFRRYSIYIPPSTLSPASLLWGMVSRRNAE